MKGSKSSNIVESSFECGDAIEIDFGSRVVGKKCHEVWSNFGTKVHTLKGKMAKLSNLKIGGMSKFTRELLGMGTVSPFDMTEVERYET